MTTEEMSGLASIARKKAAIMGKLRQFAKDKRNQKQNYEYTSSTQIFDTIRALMADHGLALFSSATQSHQDPMESKGGTAGLHTVVQYRMTWICADTGAVFEDLWIAEGDDYQDKGYSKCATLALKYYLLTSFIVSSGDDADDTDSGVGSQDTAKRGANGSKSRNSQSSGTTSNGAKNAQNSHSDDLIENGATDTAILKSLTVVEKDGRNRLKFTTTDNRTVLAFSRKLFLERGWCDETEWMELGAVKLDANIPVGITYHLVTTDEGEIKGGYWEVSSVSEVSFDDAKAS